jgi:alginate O-acetyltransferase complex protein AlgJ
MNFRPALVNLVSSSLVFASLVFTCNLPARAADLPSSIVGKNEWIYYRYEVADAADNAPIQTSIDLISKLNQILARNNVTLAVTMVPLKMRIYQEHLPPELKLTDYLQGNYDRIAKAMRAAGLQVIDLNTPFLKDPKRAGENPFFIRLDTHWAPSGAMLAAEAIRAELDANPALKKAYDATSAVNFGMAWAKKKNASKARDLVEQLPKGTPANFAPEQLLSFSITRNAGGKDNLVGDEAAPGIALVGSSYSDHWTGFTDALRFTLQRDLLDISVGADKGSWVGIETYLRDASFQTQKPKLLIWEMPERDLKALPNYPYRDARYLSDNTEWLLRAAAWAEGTCNPSPIKAKIGNASLAPSKEGDALEIEFDQPLGKLDYLSLQANTSGGRQLTLEASGGAAARKFSLPLVDDGADHAVKIPLLAAGGNGGYTRVKLLPGKAKQFSVKQVTVCRHADGLLK